MANYGSVLGDRKSTKQLAAEFEEVYGVAPRLDCLGTVEELQTKMEATREKEPQNIFAWLAEYVFCRHSSCLMGGKANSVVVTTRLIS